MKTSFVILISLVVALCALTASWQFGSENVMARILLAYSVVIFTFILLDSALDRRCSFLTIVVAFYHVGMFLIPGMLHCAQGWFPFFSTRYNSEDIIYVSFLMGVYSSCFLGGYSLAKFRTPVLHVPPEHKLARTSDLKIVLISLLSIAISLPCIADVGFDYFVTRRGDLSETGPEVTPLLAVLVNVPRAASFCAALVLADRMIAHRSLIMFVLAVPVYGLTLVVNNPVTLPRYYFFSLVFVLAYASGRVIWPRAKLTLIGVLSIGLVLGLPLANSISRGAAGESFDFDPAVYLSTTGDFDGLQSMLSTYYLVQRNGLSYGLQLLGALLTFVPREIWPTKPLATGRAAGEAMNFDYVNLSAPLPAEIYVDFGLLGIVVLSLLIGYVARVIDQQAQRSILSRAPIAERMLYGGLIGYATILCRGSLLSILAPVYLYFGFVAIWLWFGPTRVTRTSGAVLSRQLR